MIKANKIVPNIIGIKILNLSLGVLFANISSIIKSTIDVNIHNQSFQSVKHIWKDLIVKLYHYEIVKSRVNSTK
jgi:Na+/pantothenate symporter